MELVLKLQTLIFDNDYPMKEFGRGFIESFIALKFCSRFNELMFWPEADKIKRASFEAILLSRAV